MERRTSLGWGAVLPCAALLSLAWVAGPTAAQASPANPPLAVAAAGPDQILDLPAAFAVTNINRSQVQCSSDGAGYTIKGHLVGPRSLLTGPAPRAVTVYMHGLSWGEYYWHFKAVPGYDYATELARLGHVSLTYDLLGYGASGRPVGTQVCYGSQADVAHQIIASLRSGSYTLSGLSPPTFQRVALASHIAEALTSEPEAYSFQDIDALIITSYADELPTQYLLLATQQAATFCAMGGEPADGGGGPSGYVYIPLADADFKIGYFYNADPAVVSAATAMRTRTPCGEPQSAGQSIVDNQAMLRQVAVPVLLAYGKQDYYWNQPASGENQKGRFVMSPSVTAVYLDNTGSALALERTAPQFRSIVSQWLCKQFEKCASAINSSGSNQPAPLLPPAGVGEGLPQTAPSSTSLPLLAVLIGALSCLALVLYRRQSSGR